MGDKLLNSTQVINGLAVLLSFFVGYKYAVKRNAHVQPAANISESKGDVKETTERLFFSISDNYKMVLVVRVDLKMGKGKIAAQCCHGAVGAYQKAIRKCPRIVEAWEHSGCAKVALKVENEQELMEIKRLADAKTLVTCLVRDAGRTQIEPNTKTVLAIGPASVEHIDIVTGHLKLL